MTRGRHQAMPEPIVPREDDDPTRPRADLVDAELMRPCGCVVRRDDDGVVWWVSACLDHRAELFKEKRR